MRTLFLAVTGISLGVIACSSGETSVMPVERTPVASVAISLPSPALLVGQSVKGTATPMDASGTPLTDRVISWNSSSTAIATVDNSGMVAGVARGNAVISAVSEGVTGQTSVAIMDPSPAPVASVSVALASQSLNPGQTAQATATARDAGGNVLAGRTIAWSTSNTAVATVSTSGVVSAVGVGSAQITATSEGQNGSATLTVVAPAPVPVASVSVALASSSLNPGQTTQATATTRDASSNVLTGRAIAWSSSNTAVATVDASGLVSAVAVGSAQITAASEGKSGSASLTVAAVVVPVASVTVALASGSINTGQTTQATATTRDASNNVLTGRVITWSSSNTGVATVSSSGLVTAIAIGTVQILASCEGKSGSGSLDVSAAPVASVTVTLGAGSLNPAQTTQATAVTRDANNNVVTGRTIAWASNNNAFATVSPTGLVTAVAVGTAQITATSEGQSGSATLDVRVPGASNEPSGMTVISDRPFNAINELGWADDGGPGGAILADATAPKSPSSILRTTLPAGFHAGGGSYSGDYDFTGYRTLYVSFWAKLSSNWQGSDSGVDKQFYVYTTTGIPSVYFDCYGTEYVPKSPQIAGQDIIHGGTGSDPLNPDWGPNLVPSAVIPRGTWYRVELVLVGNTAGNADGSIDWYLDGVHVGSRTGVQFIAGAARWSVFHYTNLWSGASSFTTRASQTLDWDHVYLSGK